NQGADYKALLKKALSGNGGALRRLVGLKIEIREKKKPKRQEHDCDCENESENARYRHNDRLWHILQFWSDEKLSNFLTSQPTRVQVAFVDLMFSSEFSPLDRADLYYQDVLPKTWQIIVKHQPAATDPAYW